MSNKIYTTVPVPKFPRNVFSLSRPVAGSVRMQRNYPTEILEVIPGDAFNVHQETFLRTQPLVAPPLAKVKLSHHAFFVPCWQLHKSFDDFITGGEKMDFNDHMPYTYVQDVYNWIYSILAVTVDILDTYDDFVMVEGLSELCSNGVEYAVSLIEAFDYSRAIPFTMPEFMELVTIDGDGDPFYITQLTQSDWQFGGEDTPSPNLKALQDIAAANLDAFTKLNEPTWFGASVLHVNLLPFYAQLKIWSEYFRDENLVDDYWDELKESSFFSATDYNDLGSGVYDHAADWGDVIEDFKQFVRFFALKKRAWKKDRFTSALPWTQKGPDVVIPLSGSVPVSVTGGDVAGTSGVPFVGMSTSKSLVLRDVDGSLQRSVVLDGSADLTQASGLSTMRDLRRAEAVEEFSEADGRFGNRYPENTLGQFGVYTPDSRLPRCLFLGSTSQVVSFGEIPQTSETADTPLGTLAGKGTSYNPSFLFKGRFTMHGFIIIFTSVTVQAMYEGGIHPMFSRFDRTEYAWPRYARLGEEPIYTKELFVDNTVGETTVFGYAPRYSTYKSDTGSIHGQMKSTLSYWTFSRKFKNLPQLNKEFIYNDPRKDAFAITNPYAEQFLFEIDWKVRSSRLLPFYGVPSI